MTEGYYYEFMMMVSLLLVVWCEKHVIIFLFL